MKTISTLMTRINIPFTDHLNSQFKKLSIHQNSDVPLKFVICYSEKNILMGVILMPTSTNLIDLSPLPASARREIRDFYEFLLSRRIRSRQKARTRTLPSAFDAPIKVKEYLKVSRDELYDEI